MSDAFCPGWKYNNNIVEFLMKISAAKEIVNLLNLPLNIEEKLKYKT